mgnify:CR=1 FL=1
MSLDNLDDYIENDPDDFKICAEHERKRPCIECRLEAEEYDAECAREEDRHERR